VKSGTYERGTFISVSPILRAVAMTEAVTRLLTTLAFSLRGRMLRQVVR